MNWENKKSRRLRVGFFVSQLASVCRSFSLFFFTRFLEAVLKLLLPLPGYDLLPCHSERSAAESKNLLIWPFNPGPGQLE